MRSVLWKLKVFFRNRKSLKKYYSYISHLKKKIFSYIDSYRFEKYINVYKDQKLIFKIIDMGEISRWRADLFDTKEPETLEWIDGFSKHDNFLDIGANIGVYSIYAALRNLQVIAIEPDSLNYALLNLNIRKNNLNNLILPYSIALNDIEKFSIFNISSLEWGGALNSFGNQLDYKGNTFNPVHKQGVYGLPLDDFLDQTNVFPNHIKIDVDGNEFLILKGAINTLKSESLKSILVELDELRNDYQDSIALIQSCGFELINKTHAKMFDNSDYRSTYNHIFKRS